MQEIRIHDVESWFNYEIRKHPSFLLFDILPTNFLIPSETYARSLLGNWDQGLKILDIGCGDALDSITIAASSNKVWAIDIALNRLALAHQNVEQVEMSSRVLPLCMDAHYLSFPNDYFDLIVGNSVLLFLDRPRFAKECYRVLKPGSHALFPNESMKKHPLLLIRRALSGVRVRESVANRITLRDIDEISKQFDHVNHREFYLISVLLAPLIMRFGNQKLVSRVTNSVYGIDDFILRALPQLRDLCWISVIDLWKRSNR